MSGADNQVRTVLGDVPADRLGMCFAHEHLIIDGGVPALVNPGISLPRVEDAVAELGPCAAAGVRTVVDAMPADAGRNVVKLAEVSRRAGVHVVAATGLHHARYYGERHWGELLAAERLAELFVADLEEGVDAHDCNGPVVARTPHRAGVVKVAGSLDGPSDRDRRVFEAAAQAAARTGAPVLTHCEAGTGGLAQLRLLDDLGVPLDRVTLSHTDKVADRGYHRDLLASGAYVVYDQGLRTPETTARLVRWMVEDGHGDRLLLGTDGARRSLWSTLGGAPGLAALATGLGRRLAGELGRAVMDRIWVANPAAALALRQDAPGASGAPGAPGAPGQRR
jgi:5-phospho-D-xylono-1,4-lactonase